MKALAVTTLFLLSLALLPAPASAARAERDAPGEIVVTLKPGADGGAVARKYHLETIGHVDDTGVYAYRARKAKAALKKLRKDARVASAQPNGKVRRHQTISFPYSTPEVVPDGGEAAYRGQLDAGPLADASLKAAQAFPASDDPVVVAVVDTGVDFAHPALAGRLWRNDAEANGTTGVDDDADGTVDDVRGYDFVDNDADPGETTADGPVAGHGTFISGLVALGSARARIMPVRVLDGQGVGTDFTAAAGITYAAAHGASMICISFGVESDEETAPPALVAAIDFAAAHRVAIIAASGNDGGAPPRYPAGDDDVLSVGASSALRIADFSNIAASDAPGVDLVSAYPGETGEDGQYRARYARWSGTSFAAGVTAAAFTEIIDPSLGTYSGYLRYQQVVPFGAAFFQTSGPAYAYANSPAVRLNALDLAGVTYRQDGRRGIVQFSDFTGGTASGSASGGMILRTYTKGATVVRQISAAAAGLTAGASYRLVARFGSGGPVTLAEAAADSGGDVTLVKASGSGLDGAISAPLTTVAEVSVVDAGGGTVLSWSRGARELQTFSLARIAVTSVEPSMAALYMDAAFRGSDAPSRVVRFDVRHATDGATYVVRADGVEVGRAIAAISPSDENQTQGAAFQVNYQPAEDGSTIPAVLEDATAVGRVEIYRLDPSGEVLVGSADLSAR